LRLLVREHGVGVFLYWVVLSPLTSLLLLEAGVVVRLEVVEALAVT
jgi:hypothetical protein